MALSEKVLHDLLFQAAETERGGIEIYETALQCVRNPDLRKEWTKYLAQTRRHAEITQKLLDDFGLQREEETSGRVIVRSIGQTLVAAMREAMSSGDRAVAEIVAGECVVLAETKDHLNWKLLSECAGSLRGDERDALKAAVDEVEDEEDEHLYHSTGWTRELWLQCLGLGGVLPPPEEERHVKSAIGAARAEMSREERVPKRQPRRKKVAATTRSSSRRSARPKARGRGARRR